LTSTSRNSSKACDNEDHHHYQSWLPNPS
jgi:hypothetical protein